MMMKLGKSFVFSQCKSTALIFAAASGHTESVRLLLKAGADTTATDKVRLRYGAYEVSPYHDIRASVVTRSIGHTIIQTYSIDLFL